MARMTKPNSDKLWRQSKWLDLVKANPRNPEESVIQYVKRLEGMLGKYTGGKFSR